MAIIKTIALDLLVSTICDIIKFTGNKLYCSGKDKAKSLKETVEAAVTKNAPDDFLRLFESSIFVSYFNSPQFLDVINAYLEHKIICSYTSENARVQKLLKKSGTIHADDIVDYITERLLMLYHKNNVVWVPPEATLRSAVAYILDTAQHVCAQNLSPESSQLLFFLHTYADEEYAHIVSMLTHLQSSIEQIQQKQLAPNTEEYEATREKYHAILKDRNAQAHIYLLDKFPFEQFYVPPVLQYVSSGRKASGSGQFSLHGLFLRPTPWNEIFLQSNIVYLTGGAGYGKSLFTQKIINSSADLTLFHSKDYLVIRGELKAFYPNGSDCALSVLEFLKASVKSSTLMEVSDEFITHYLDAGRCIILLDALDEVEKSKRAALHETVVAFFKHQNPNNKVCITSRERGFIPEKDVEVYMIRPLNAKQIERYVDKIIALGKFEQADKEPFMTQTEILVQKGFLNSFLVLSLLINIYKAERELPENKLELYQKCFEYIANRRERDKTQREFDWRAISPIMKDSTFIALSQMAMPNNSSIDRQAIKEQLVQTYSRKYGSEVDAENAVEEFLKFCSDRTELFVPTAEDQFKFFHRSFFEYFYARYIFLNCQTEQAVIQELLRFDVDSEVFELIVAMLKQQSETRYQALIELLFERSEQELAENRQDFPVFNILILSMQVIDDVDYRQRFLQIILSHRSLLLTNWRNIHNLKLLRSIYENDDEAYNALCEVYWQDGALFLFSGCCKIAFAAKKYDEELRERFFSMEARTVRNAMQRRNLSSRSINLDHYFYLPVFTKCVDCAQLLDSADAAMLRTVFQAANPKTASRKAVEAAEALELYRSLPKKAQEQFIQLVLSYDQ